MRHSAVVFAVLLASTASSSAFEGSPETFAESLRKVMSEDLGASFGWNSIRGDGDRVFVDGATVWSPSSGGSILRTDLVFDGIEGDPASGYVVQATSVPDLDLPAAVGSIGLKLQGLGLGHFGVRGSNDIAPGGRTLLPASAIAKSVILSVAGKNILSLTDPVFASGRVGDDIISDFVVASMDLDVDAWKSVAPTSFAPLAFAGAGYPSMKGSAQFRSSWTPSTSTFSVSGVRLDVEEVATTEAAFSFAGVDMGTVKAAASWIGAGPAMDATAMADALLGLSWRGGSFEYDDAGFLERVSSRIGQQAEETQQQVLGTLTAALSAIPLSNDQRVGILEGVTSLAAGGGIRIASEPAVPMRLSDLGTLARLLPMALPQLLSVRVEAAKNE